MTDETIANLAGQLRKALLIAPGDNLFGVVDGAQDVELAYEARQLYGAGIRMLFRGRMATSLADVAPYIVPIDPEQGYLRHWAARFGMNAGILLTTPADAETLFDHLRDVFLAKDEEGNGYYFRFYDPRVLRVYLKACSEDERGHFFGPIRAAVMEAPSPEGILVWESHKSAPTVIPIPPTRRGAA